MNEYDEIINMPHHVSSKHPQMSMIDRGAQFAPFAALRGYDQAINDLKRDTEPEMKRDEFREAELMKRFELLNEVLDSEPTVVFSVFVPNERKSEGQYVAVKGIVRRLDKYNGEILMKDGRTLMMKDIADLKGEIFADL